MKKRYIKPSIIDLSIEGMTGFGYGVLSANCRTGTDFLIPTCGVGQGANGSCSPQGAAPTNECSGGFFPSDRGTYCVSGDSANGRECGDGFTVSGFNPSCHTGGHGFSVGDSNPDCTPGATANYCFTGNSNVGPFS